MNTKFSRRLSSFCREAAGAAMYWSGSGHAFELVARPTGAIILMYHSIASDGTAEYVDPRNRISPALFEQQMAFLAEYRRVASLSQVVDQISSNASPPAGTVCITFDDGYLDNLTVAAPILEKYKLPATLYLATGYVERVEAQWADILYWLRKRRTSDKLSLPFAGLEGVSLTTPAAQAAVWALLHSHLLESSYDNRIRLLSDVKRQLAPAGKLPQLGMNWDDVRELCRRYPRFEIGGHTRDHIDLRTHHGEVALLQLNGCASDLRRELGLEPGHFSFPYGRCCAETRDMVRAGGWKSAVGDTGDLRITAASDPFSMQRVEAPRTSTALRFKTSSAYPGALSMLGLM